MNQYWVMVKYKDEPGAGFGRVVLNADNPYQAIQMAKAILIILGSIMPIVLCMVYQEEITQIQ